MEDQEIISRIIATPYGQLPAIAHATGVSFPALVQCKYKIVNKPRKKTLDKLRGYFEQAQ